MPQTSLPDLIAAVRSGQALISFPTDTVPALASRPDAAGLIYAAKQRSESKPLILMGASAADLWDYVQGDATELSLWQQVAAQYWPGALTLVLPASPRLPSALNPSDPTTVGLRVPNHPVARQILAQSQPLATTSVNRSGQPALLDFDQINQQFPEVLTLSTAALAQLKRSVEGSVAGSDYTSGSGQPSTVAKWTAQGWQILRQGQIRL
ncbi:MAG: L-threonylcarbamoyladenylate synthase [Pegethrix bostrychoides GSE-TBD4-15B]|jgi:L-threonylcarbamoyladenylate synthase|uniref:L-threonylcarbamoyladenylate synthase n=1 Tax=Pegethrix bostrychoides GSE-TBD4-15B TaxID=2839662 RepID=A0A951P8M9_9CYAN|nr:L-threonylcarbamoyladenylate synthase [Pegethrix bostrychoides GSE-TBD4-15B]